MGCQELGISGANQVNWNELIFQLGTFGIGATAIVTAVSYLGKMLTTHWMDNAATEFKIQLQSTCDREMEQLRSHLQVKAIEHEIRFRSIHERQAQALADTYAKLYEVQRAVASYVKLFGYVGEPTADEKLKDISLAYEGFRASFFPQRVFFPKKIGDRIRELGNRLAEATNEYTRAMRRMAGDTSSQHRDSADDYEGRLSTALKIVQKDVPLLLEELEIEFQSLLGVSNPPGTEHGS